MSLRVRQVEAPAKGVAELVVQRHADGAEAHCAEPGAILGFFARGLVVGGLNDGGEG